MKKSIEIINYPEGNIINVTKEQLDILTGEGLVSYDNEWTEEKPNGQWGFNQEDEEKILAILTPVNDKQEQTEATKGQIFLDEGDFDRTGEPNELYIRGRLNDETFDICSFGCNDTGFALDYATALVARYNQASNLYRDNAQLKEQIKQIREALTGIIGQITDDYQTVWSKLEDGLTDEDMTALQSEINKANAALSNTETI